jgi:hypothetical protein
VLLNETKFRPGLHRWASRSRTLSIGCSCFNVIETALKSYEAWRKLGYNQAGGKVPGENHADHLPSKR